MAKEIENHTLPKDTWLTRGEDIRAFNGRFNIDFEDLEKNGKLNSLIGLRGVEEAFLSTSPTQGKGFGGKIKLEIFAPKGTQAVFADPFSYYGHGSSGWSKQGSAGLKWKGKSDKGFNINETSSEYEMIVNQGYEMEILSIEKEYYGYRVKVALHKRKSFYNF